MTHDTYQNGIEQFIHIYLYLRCCSIVGVQV